MPSIDPLRRRRTLDALRPYIERARSHTGWSHAGLTTRHLDSPPPWDYEALARERALRATRVLDLGTGGGEVLSRVAARARARIVATEEWEPNVPVARTRLAPLGADVVRCRSMALPFARETFDLVLDRHEELDPAEMARVLTPGGRALTQQCGADEWPELRAYFPRKQHFGDLFNGYANGFRAAGLDVPRAERHRARVAFGSLGDVVYMLLVAPWTVPGFDPEANIDALVALADGLSSPEGIILTEERFLIEAARP